MKIDKEMIRKCIFKENLNDRINNYIIPLQELSSTLATMFIDYSDLFNITFKMLDEKLSSVSKPKFSISVYHFYKWNEDKMKLYNDIYEEEKRSKIKYSIPIREIKINFLLSGEEIIKSVNDFIKAVRDWNLETDEGRWKRNIKDLTPYVEKMFNELTFFRHVLYSAFLKDGSYEYPPSNKISIIRNYKALSSLLYDYIGTFNGLYSDMITIEHLIQDSVDVFLTTDFNDFNFMDNLSKEDIDEIINNKNIQEESEPTDDDF